MNTDGHRSEKIFTTSRLIESGFVLISVLDSSVLICVDLCSSVVKTVFDFRAQKMRARRSDPTLVDSTHANTTLVTPDSSPYATASYKYQLGSHGNGELDQPALPTTATMQ
jgi:hypothetical protein